jgi:hypothetical protein
LNARAAVGFALFISALRLPAQVPAKNRLNDVAINAAIGALSGATWAMIRRTRVWDGARRGVEGGVLTSVGRQTAGSVFYGSGLIGREISAIGVSTIANVGLKAQTFSFPVGPLSILYGDGKYDWRLNVTDLALTAGAAASHHTRLDAGLSLRAGAPVFRVSRPSLNGVSPGGETAGGASIGGVIWMSDGAFDSKTGKPFALYHETVHVLQEDFVDGVVGNPVEAVFIGKTRLGRRFLRHLDLGLSGNLGTMALAAVIPYRSRPWEREAFGLASRVP